MVAVTRVWWVQASGVCSSVTTAEVPALLAGSDGFVWIDVEDVGEDTRSLLVGTLQVPERAVPDFLERNHIARIHRWPMGMFVGLHRPLRGESGHVHFLELDLLVGQRFVLTTHGPRNAAVPLEAMLTETTEVSARLVGGRLTPRSPWALAYAVISSVTNAMERMVNGFARDVGLLEQRVMASPDTEPPQEFLDELFITRHALLTVQTMASQGAEVFARAIRLSDGELDTTDHQHVDDLEDQYHRLWRIAHSQLAFLQGVTDFYRARNDTRMTIAGERLAVIAAVTLPVTAISSIVGMNVIVGDQTHWGLLITLLALMGGLSAWLLRWAHRQGWW